MDKLMELLEQLRNPGEEGVPETIYDDIAGVYNEALEIRDAKINELDAVSQEREAQISQLKSANYDLLMASGNQSSDDEGDDSETDEADEPSGIDSLFDEEN